MGIEISIPEELVQESLEKIVDRKFDQKKVVNLLSDLTKPIVFKAVDEVKVYLESKLSQDLTLDLEVQREMIIEGYLNQQRANIFLNDVKVGTTPSDAHKDLPKLVSFLKLFRQAMIVGPTGSGKSTMAKQAADTLGLRFSSFSCNLEASKAELVGFQNLNGYVESNFLDFYENGGVFLIDEYDAMSASISVVLNAVFDRSGQIAIPNRTHKPIAVKHNDFYCILAGNTWGSGSVEYQGRDLQDAAFLDRFKMCRIYVDYDEKLERKIADKHYDWMIKIRDFIANKVDNEKFSTRSIYDATVLLHNNFGRKEILKMISSHWDETIRSEFFRSLK